MSGTSDSSAAAPLRRTPLYHAHLAAHAKMVDFGGWDMPVHYGSQLDEHHLVRNDAGVFDVSHMCNVDAYGADAEDFLRALLANDVRKLAIGQALYSCMLNAEGGVIDDLIVYRLQPSEVPRYRIVVNAGTADGDFAWMQQFAQQRGFGLTLRMRRDLAMVAVQGPQAWAKFAVAQPALAALAQQGEGLKPFHAVEAGDYLVARTGYTGEDGLEWVLPASEVHAAWDGLLAAGVRPAGLGARDTLRLEAGMNLYGQDMDTTVTPLECGLAWTVDRKTDPARQFEGRSVLDAGPAKRSAIGLKLLDRGVLRSHMAVRTVPADGAAPQIGETTSGSYAPTLAASIAMARMPAGSAKAGDTVEVEIRGKWYKALVVKMPFARNGKALV